jgi:DHA2 family multidrug resistance protein
MVIGFGLYSAVYLTPIFLGRVRGYSSMDIGTTVFVAGILMTFGAPLAARLTTVLDQRIVIAVGFSLFALSCWLMAQITPVWGFWELLAPQALRGFSLLLCIVPAVGMALNGVPPEQLRYASGLFNLMRNMGGAIGIAAATTFIQDHVTINAERFSESMSSANTSHLGPAIAQIARHSVDAVHARLMLDGELMQAVGAQALTLSFRDVFLIMGAIFVMALVLVPFAKTVILSDAPPVSEH